MVLEAVLVTEVVERLLQGGMLNDHLFSTSFKCCLAPSCAPYACCTNFNNWPQKLPRVYTA